LGTNEVFVHVISAIHSVFPFLSLESALLRNLSSEYATYQTNEFFSTINKTENRYLVTFIGITNYNKELITGILAADGFNADLGSFISANLKTPISALQIRPTTSPSNTPSLYPSYEPTTSDPTAQPTTSYPSVSPHEVDWWTGKWSRCDLDFKSCLDQAPVSKGVRYREVYCGTSKPIAQNRQDDTYGPGVIFEDQACQWKRGDRAIPKPHTREICQADCPVDLNTCAGEWSEWSTCSRCCKGSQKRMYRAANFNVNGQKRCPVDMFGLSQNQTCSLDSQQCKEDYLFEWSCDEYTNCDADYNQCQDAFDKHVHGSKQRECKCAQQMLEGGMPFKVIVSDEYCSCEKPETIIKCTIKCPGQEQEGGIWQQSGKGSSLSWLFMFSAWTFLKNMC